jgi:hypothetical protein
MSLRARLTSFVAGFGVAGGATFYQLHKDITAGTQYLSEQVSVAPGRDTKPAYATLTAATAGCSVWHVNLHV